MSCVPLHEWLTNFDSDYLNDLLGVELPKVVMWPSNSDVTAFVDIYDWDVISLSKGSILSIHIDLCTKIYPCFLSVVSDQNLTMSKIGGGSLSCSQSLGCEGILLNLVHVVCDSTKSMFSFLEVDGSRLEITSSSFDGCHADQDGGAIRAYSSSSTEVVVSNSVFRGCSSNGFGGAISVVGGSLLLSNSTFENCSSRSGGGAISGAEFTCYGSRQVIDTRLDISGSRFDRCNAAGDGGAMLLTSASVFGKVLSSTFTGCRAGQSGGAASVGPLSMLVLEHSAFIGNVAEGRGGGAVHSNGPSLAFGNLSFTQNSALSGGGGAIFYDGVLTSLLGDANLDGAPALSREDLKCDGSNSAQYGSCLASSYSTLQVVGLPTKNTPASPGLPFALVAVKKDVFNTTVSSDSISILKVQTELNDQVIGKVETSVTAVAGMVEGQAVFSIVIKPLFTLTGQSIRMEKVPNIFISGFDSQTGGQMQSEPLQVEFSQGSTVCPIGYVLLFDTGASSGARVHGFCSLCGPGTYSINPLAGPSESLLPSCFKCLLGARCTGGSSVELPIGQWTVYKGWYLLIGCPEGHQLVNSVAGVFSRDVQQCAACKEAEYIVDSNNSNFQCQPCPAGAICDGGSLRGKVNGSLWKADNETGLFALMSCPPGFAVAGHAGAVDQECLVCPAAYFCTGGSVPAVPCVDGSFAPPGSTSSQACVPTVFVSVSVLLPLAREAFASEQQGHFAEALGDSCGTLPSTILIWSIQSVRRSGQSSSIQVDAKIAASDPSSANAIGSKIEAAALNAQLLRQGLPVAVVKSVAIILGPSGPGTDSLSPSTWIALWFCMSLSLFFLAVLTVRSCAKKRTAAEEALEAQFSQLRKQLHITLADGFMLSSERVSIWRWKSLVQIPRIHLETAARLAVLQDFDVEIFDAFCLLLDVAGLSQGAQHSKQHIAICTWLLDLSEGLIKPEIEEDRPDQSGSQVIIKVQAPKDNKRFQFLQRKVLKARVWLQNDQELFLILQDKAQRYMDHIATLCDLRSREMMSDLGGAELARFGTDDSYKIDENGSGTPGGADAASLR